MRRFKSECAHFSFNKCPVYTHDGASAKFGTNSHERDNSDHSTAEQIKSEEYQAFLLYHDLGLPRRIGQHVQLCNCACFSGIERLRERDVTVWADSRGGETKMRWQQKLWVFFFIFSVHHSHCAFLLCVCGKYCIFLYKACSHWLTGERVTPMKRQHKKFLRYGPLCGPLWFHWYGFMSGFYGDTMYLYINKE
jgi:hypothetical protein